MTAPGRLRLALIVLGIVLAIGTFGYASIQDMSLLDALYMSVITITTVGFKEVVPLSADGRLFTIGLVLVGFGSLSVTLTAFAAQVISGDILSLRKGRRMQRNIASLCDHYIICGYGVAGREVALEFARSGVPFVVIERDPEHAEKRPHDDFLVIPGDASDEETLEDAGIDRARGLVAALHSDADNVFVCLTARQLNAKLTIVARATAEGAERKLRQAGADNVISPYQIAGRRMAAMLLRPSVVNFLDIVVGGTGSEEDLLRLEECAIHAESALVGKSLRDSGVGQATGAIILAIRGPDGAMRRGPEEHARLAGTILESGDALMALGSPKQLELLRDLTGDTTAALGCE